MARIDPYGDMRYWRQCCTTQLADADRYYEKWEIDKIITGEMPIEEIQEMVDEAVSGAVEDLATKEALDNLAQQVSANTAAILDRYTKEETNSLLTKYLTKLEANSMFANYSKVENTTLVLNNENIGI